MISDEEAELVRCNRYFDIVDTVLNKIDSSLKESEITELTKDDWEIIREHIKGLSSVFSDYNQLRESLGI